MNYKVKEESLKAIGDKLRECSGESEGLKLSEMPGKIQDIFDAGKKAEYDAFWDAFQEYGERTDYALGFAGKGWTNETFKPKYPIAPTNAFELFRNTGLKNFDFVEAGVQIDFSKCTSFNYCFGAQRGIKRLGIIDVRGATNLSYMFYNSSVETIEKFIVDEENAFSYTFSGNDELKKLIVEGTIANNFSVSSKLLTKESLLSTINALSSSTTGLTVTFSKTAINNAFGIDVDDVSTYPEGSEYYILRQSKSNWTISYV